MTDGNVGCDPPDGTERAGRSDEIDIMLEVWKCLVVPHYRIRDVLPLHLLHEVNDACLGAVRDGDHRRTC
jgi:hypothetical protein